MEIEIVVKENFSEFGLGQLHVVRMGSAVEEEAWLEEIWEKGGDVQAKLAWEEYNLGAHHLVIYWRLKMVEYPMYVMHTGKIGVETAAALAAERFKWRMGEWPNQAAVRELPEGKEKLSVSLHVDGGTVLEVEVRACKGMMRGDIGVWRSNGKG